MIELRVNVDPSLTDALGSCLFEAGAEGVAEQEDDEGSWLVLYCTEPEQATRLTAAVDDFRARARLVFPDAEVGPVQRSEVARDWETTWLSALQPARITDELVLRPTHAAPAPEGERTLWFEPAPCFGSGDHATTRLAARAVERAIAELVTTRRSTSELTTTEHATAEAAAGPLDVLDVGTGSGVLCLVAACAGATRTYGIDIDATAIDAAARNAALNSLSAHCSFTTAPLAAVDERAAVVVANIDAPTLRELAEPLLAHVAPAGVLLLTGLLDEQEQEVLDCFRARGARLDGRDQEGDWVLLRLRPGPG